MKPTNYWFLSAEVTQNAINKYINYFMKSIKIYIKIMMHVVHRHGKNHKSGTQTTTVGEMLKQVIGSCCDGPQGRNTTSTHAYHPCAVAPF